MPSSAPVMKPMRRPTRVIHMDAGKVMIAVPRNMPAIGIVASSGLGVICAPARPPTVITRTETVWKSACAVARSSTWRCIGLLSIVRACSMNEAAPAGRR